MSYPYNYLPIPPRAWSRVQSACTYIVPDSSYNTAYIPISDQSVSQAQANYEMQMYSKGNVLQYKGNSAQLTKKQKYSQLANGGGPNRTKVFATQSQTYSNPNMKALLRVNYSTYPYPNDIVGAPNNPSGPFDYNVPNPSGCSSTLIQDGGSLVCGTLVDPCSGQVIESGDTTAVVCSPASASNVPGSSILCWNLKLQSWFPRQRYVMTNSGNKWPQGYKGFQSAATPLPPILSLSLVDYGYSNKIKLSWTFNNSVCVPLSSFKIYENGTWIASVPYPLTEFTTSLSNSATNTFYVTALSYNVESQPSNTVSQPSITV